MFNFQTLENWFQKSQGFVGELSKIIPHGTVVHLNVVIHGIIKDI